MNAIRLLKVALVHIVLGGLLVVLGLRYFGVLVIPFDAICFPVGLYLAIRLVAIWYHARGMGAKLSDLTFEDIMMLFAYITLAALPLIAWSTFFENLLVTTILTGVLVIGIFTVQFKNYLYVDEAAGWLLRLLFAGIDRIKAIDFKGIKLPSRNAKSDSVVKVEPVKPAPQTQPIQIAEARVTPSVQPTQPEPKPAPRPEPERPVAPTTETRPASVPEATESDEQFFAREARRSREGKLNPLVFNFYRKQENQAKAFKVNLGDFRRDLEEKGSDYEKKTFEEIMSQRLT